MYSCIKCVVVWYTSEKYAYLKQLLHVIVTVLMIFTTDSEREKAKAARKYVITEYICLKGPKRGYVITECT